MVVKISEKHGIKIKEEEDEEKDIEELKEVLNAVTDFVKGLKEPVKDVLEMVTSSLSGEKLGKEVSALYKSLKDSGIPEDMARNMVQEYFRKRLDSALDLKKLMEIFTTSFKGGKITSSPYRGKGLEEAIGALEKVKELKPEKKEKIEKAIKLLKSLSEEESERPKSSIEGKREYSE